MSFQVISGVGVAGFGDSGRVTGAGAWAESLAVE